MSICVTLNYYLPKGENNNWTISFSGTIPGLDCVNFNTLGIITSVGHSAVPLVREQIEYNGYCRQVPTVTPYQFKDLADFQDHGAQVIANKINNWMRKQPHAAQ